MTTIITESSKLYRNLALVFLLATKLSDSAVYTDVSGYVECQLLGKAMAINFVLHVVLYFIDQTERKRLVSNCQRFLSNFTHLKTEVRFFSEQIEYFFFSFEDPI